MFSDVDETLQGFLRNASRKQGLILGLTGVSLFLSFYDRFFLLNIKHVLHMS